MRLSPATAATLLALGLRSTLALPAGTTIEEDAERLLLRVIDQLPVQDAGKVDTFCPAPPVDKKTGVPAEPKCRFGAMLYSAAPAEKPKSRVRRTQPETPEDPNKKTPEDPGNGPPAPKEGDLAWHVGVYDTQCTRMAYADVQSDIRQYAENPPHFIDVPGANKLQILEILKVDEDLDDRPDDLVERRVQIMYDGRTYFNYARECTWKGEGGAATKQSGKQLCVYIDFDCPKGLVAEKEAEDKSAYRLPSQKKEGDGKKDDSKKEETQMTEEEKKKKADEEKKKADEEKKKAEEEKKKNGEEKKDDGGEKKDDEKREY